MDESPAWGIEPVPDRLRVLGTLDSFLLWTNLGISLLVLVSSAYFGLSLKQALLATVVGGAARQPDARRRSDDRRRRARAVDGVAARAARPARLVHRDGAERAAVPRLVGVRDHGDRRRGRLALRPPLRRAPRVDVEARIRRARARAGAARAGRLRPPLRAQGRHLGGRRVDRLPRGVDHPQRPRRQALARGRAGRLVLARRRPRDRAHRLVGPARRRLHALLAQTGAPRSSAPGSATCCRRSSSSASAPCSCSRIRRSAARPTC